jgi:hypothetical protein
MILLLNFLHLRFSSVEGFRSTNLQRSHKWAVTVKTDIQTVITGTENAIRKLEPNQQEPVRYIAVKKFPKCFRTVENPIHYTNISIQ